MGHLVVEAVTLPASKASSGQRKLGRLLITMRGLSANIHNFFLVLQSVSQSALEPSSRPDELAKKLASSHEALPPSS
jgi:hypothetical protein